MDYDRFDAVARLVSTRQPRRGALMTLAGAALLGASSAMTTPDANAKRRKGKGQRKQRPCFPGIGCVPGQGSDNAGCDFSYSTAFFEGDFHGSDFSGANFTGAQMAGSNLQGADLAGACLVGANLLKADLDGADLDEAILCRTLMPDGSTNDSGCDAGTRCCPTPSPTCPGGVCGADTCIYTVDGICAPVFGAPCCPGFTCTPSAGIIIANCEVPCDSDQDCANLGSPYVCRGDFGACPFFPGSRCCRPVAGD